MSVSLSSPIIRAPGFSRLSVYSILNYGQSIRDQFVWEFPILPGAVYTYQQMASGRELKVSGFAKGVSRAIEWLQAAETRSFEGLVFKGFEDFEKRRVLDYLCVGRTVYAAPEDGPLEYLDPTRLSFNLQQRTWQDTLYGRTFKESEVFVNHPIPVGASGAFMSPLAFIMPTAMLAWLIREHDKASADGRKLRDVIVVQGEELATQIKSAIEQMIEFWSGADPSKNGVPVVHTDIETNGTGGVATQDLIARIGISEIPQGFDRQGFQFEYVNEIAAALGISLRHFWNSERATNRALEEVQEARQAQKGPSSYVRTEQRLFNQSGMLKRFGSNVRMAFIEEVDVQSRKTNAEVLKLYADSAMTISKIAPGLINLEALFGWLQSDDILPSDIEILNANWKNVMTNPDSLPTADGTEAGIEQQNSDPQPSLMNEKSYRHPDDELGYGEVSMTLDGKIVERRNRMITVEREIAKELANDAEFLAELAELKEVRNFDDLLLEAREKNADKFFSTDPDLLQQVLGTSSLSEKDFDRLISLTPETELTDDDHQKIGLLILKILETENGE